MRNKNTNDLCDVFPPYSSSSSSPSSPFLYKVFVFTSLPAELLIVCLILKEWMLHLWLCHTLKLRRSSSFTKWQTTDRQIVLRQPRWSATGWIGASSSVDDVVETRSTRAMWFSREVQRSEAWRLQSIWTKQANRNITSQPVKRAKKKQFSNISD